MYMDCRIEKKEGIKTMMTYIEELEEKDEVTIDDD